jgi:hypothetical protein
MNAYLEPWEIKALEPGTVLLDRVTGRRCRAQRRPELSLTRDPLVWLYLTDNMSGYTHEARSFAGRFSLAPEGGK